MMVTRNPILELKFFPVKTWLNTVSGTRRKGVGTVAFSDEKCVTEIQK